MTRQQLVEQIRSKKSCLCIGLDTDIEKIPPHLRLHSDAIFEFNKAIIEATKNHCVAYKINTAFYEALGWKGWEIMERTVQHIPPQHFKIADAKRGDIGNTTHQYAKAFFETLPFDAVTVTPYMGEDSIRPFLDYPDKFTIVLGLTSNPGSADIELQKIVTKTGTSRYVYEHVLIKVAQWGTPDNLMFVIGATQPKELVKIRMLTPHHFYLVPGIGTQGGSFKDIAQKTMNAEVGLLANVSRAIIYASDKEDFATEAAIVASQYQLEMEPFI
jgi:orotidine-5'-phosphate decarboxylase